MVQLVIEGLNTILLKGFFWCKSVLFKDPDRGSVGRKNKGAEAGDSKTTGTIFKKQRKYPGHNAASPAGLFEDAVADHGLGRTGGIHSVAPYIAHIAAVHIDGGALAGGIGFQCIFVVLHCLFKRDNGFGKVLTDFRVLGPFMVYPDVLLCALSEFDVHKSS